MNTVANRHVAKIDNDERCLSLEECREILLLHARASGTPRNMRARSQLRRRDIADRIGITVGDVERVVKRFTLDEIDDAICVEEIARLDLKTSPDVPPEVLEAGDEDDPPHGFRYYFNLDPYCKRWARTRERAEQLRDHAWMIECRKRAYFEGRITEDEFEEPIDSKKLAPLLLPVRYYSMSVNRRCGQARRGRKGSLTRDQVLQIVKLNKNGLGPAQIAKLFPTNRKIVNHLLKGRCYGHITGIVRKKQREGDDV